MAMSWFSFTEILIRYLNQSLKWHPRNIFARWPTEESATPKLWGLGAGYLRNSDHWWTAATSRARELIKLSEFQFQSWFPSSSKLRGKISSYEQFSEDSFSSLVLQSNGWLFDLNIILVISWMFDGARGYLGDVTRGREAVRGWANISTDGLVLIILTLFASHSYNRKMISLLNF